MFVNSPLNLLWDRCLSAASLWCLTHDLFKGKSMLDMQKGLESSPKMTKFRSFFSLTMFFSVFFVEDFLSSNLLSIFLFVSLINFILLSKKVSKILCHYHYPRKLFLTNFVLCKLIQKKFFKIFVEIYFKLFLSPRI